MPRISLIAVVCFLAIIAVSAEGAQSGLKKPQFMFKDKTGKTVSVPVVDKYQPRKITRIGGKSAGKSAPGLVRAASIAQERAHARSKSRCWRYVKQALIAAGVVDSRPKTAYAKQAADELVRDYGFKKLPIRDPYKAPIGSVLVYGSRRAAGHVEFRTRDGFVSDFRSPTPSKRPLIAVLTKG